MADKSELCPVCGKAREKRFAPFCSKRCAQIDLGRWLKGRYVIPGGNATDAAKPPPQDEETNEN